MRMNVMIRGLNKWTSQGFVLVSRNFVSSLHLGKMIPLEEHYEKICQVGQGTYGQVFKARSITNSPEKTPTFYALKKIRTDAEKEGFPVTAMREIKLLQRLDHPNIVGLQQIAYSKNGAIFLVFDYLPHDLSGLLHQPQVRNGIT